MKLAKTTKVMDDSQNVPVVKITYLKRTVDAAVALPSGIHGSPPVDSPCLLITLNDNEASRMVIPLSFMDRNKNFKEGEFEIGNFKVGTTIKFDEDGHIEMSNGDEDLTSLINDLCEAAESITTITALGIMPVVNKSTFTALKAKIAEFVK